MASARIDGFSRPPDCVLALAEQQRVAELELGGHLGQRGRAHDRRPHLGQLALGQSRVGAEDVVGDDQAEHGVAEELEPLVGLVPGVSRRTTTGGRARAQQLGVGERVARAARPSAVELGLGVRSGPRSSLADDVVDGVAHGLQVLEVLVVDAEADACARPAPPRGPRPARSAPGSRRRGRRRTSRPR